ncbi:DUF4249 domain-containing protein [Algoriphagus namhaensis]|uniref:DUF4249 domain-containing protein n=1 Tax=Algoriphagus namhaensis TaxID=915353 RepID=A0ABV8ALX6_9BACT
MKKQFWLVMLIFCGCIDPYVVEVPAGPQYLTVEGLITTQNGPHQIRLTRGDTYGSIFEGLIRPVRSATVIIRDDLGEVTFLEENLDNRGSYLTPVNFRAEVGRSYTLQIQLIEGEVYTSLPEKVLPTPPIKKLSYQSVTVPVEGELNPASGVQLIVDIDDPAEEDNFYFWRNGPATYVLETRPDLYFTPPPGRAPAPKDCCFICYQTEVTGNQSIFIAQDDNFNGLSTQIPVAFIPDNGRRFVDTYRVDLRQINVSREAYRFLRLVKQQSEISGSVFDPPPANIRGNMISLDNPDEVVLGYFMAGGEVKERIYINGAQLDFRQPQAIIPDDCRVVEGSKLNPPADWNP